MRHLRLALVVFASALGLVRAQDDERNARPPVEIPDFSNLDEFIYVPRSTLTIGFRSLSGAKTKFAGTGHLASSADSVGDQFASNIDRVYHDGNVHKDARVTTRLDADGNPITDPTTGTVLTDPIAPDGKTNSWNYLTSAAPNSQLTADGQIAFHSYSADVSDLAGRKITGTRNSGLELAVSRDMGKLGGTRATWSLIAGMSVNDLAAKTTGTVLANINTLTDTFSLNGASVADGPYTSPSSSSITVTDPSTGNPVTNDDGSTQTATVDTSTLLSNSLSKPRDSSSQTDTTSVTNHWKLHGAYYTFRAGPQLFMPFTTRLRASLSLGAALVYAGSTYTVTQTYTPATGDDITDTSSNTTSHMLPGYFADASLQFDLTERAGFYAGAVFQSAGAYTQHVNTDAAHYSSRIDLANQNGLRAGMTIRF